MYSFNIFKRAGIAPRANALVYGIKTGLLPTSSVQDFEEYMMTNCSIEGSYDLLIFEGSTEDALKALSDAGYEDDGQGKDVLRFASGQDLLVEIEGVYADFGYPSDMESFIYYMPSDEGDSSQEVLIGRFRSFLVTERERLCL